MVSGAVLGAIAGFFGALVTLGIPLAVFLRRMDSRVRRLLRLVTGDEEVEGDGILARLRRVERMVTEHRRTIKRHDSIRLQNDETEST